MYSIQVYRSTSIPLTLTQIPGFVSEEACQTTRDRIISTNRMLRQTRDRNAEEGMLIKMSMCVPVETARNSG